MMHTLYIATCYIPYALLLLLGVTFFPAIACFPGLLRTPLLASTIPIISILISNAFALVLFFTGLYTHAVVISITAILTVIGLARGFYYCRTQPLAWSKADFYLLAINFIVLMPMIVFNGISTFMTDDALASWNFWAMHFYMGDIPDTWGYPPFFSILISYCYKLLGNPEYQGPVKALLCVFPFAIMNNIAFISKRTLQVLPVYLLLIFSCVFPGFLSVGFYKFYTAGYADPMLAATVAASVTLFIKYLSEQSEEYLWYAVLCGITAALTKQPAFLWALFSFPVILLCQFFKQKRITFSQIAAIITLIIPVAIWLLTKGGHFYHNEGVISASLHQNQVTVTSMLLTLLSSINTYFIKQPSLLLIFLLAGVAAFKQNKAAIYLVFIIPATLLWFIFGSYHIRLGLHIIISCALLIASYDYFTTAIQQRFPVYQKINNFLLINIKPIVYITFSLSFILFVIFSIREQINKHQNMPAKLYPLNAGLTHIGKYFGAGANFVYKELYNNPQIVIWSASHYIDGIFYGHTPLVGPKHGDISVAGIYRDLQQYKPDYMIAPGSIALETTNNIAKIQQQCPQLLTEIPLGNPIYGYQLYKVNDFKLGRSAADITQWGFSRGEMVILPLSRKRGFPARCEIK